MRWDFCGWWRSGSQYPLQGRGYKLSPGTQDEVWGCSLQQLFPHIQHPGGSLSQYFPLCVHSAVELSTPLGSPEGKAYKLCWRSPGEAEKGSTLYISEQITDNTPFRQSSSLQNIVFPHFLDVPWAPAVIPLLMVGGGVPAPAPILGQNPQGCKPRGPWPSERSKASSVKRHPPFYRQFRDHLLFPDVFFRSFFSHLRTLILTPNLLS